MVAFVCSSFLLAPCCTNRTSVHSEYCCHMLAELAWSYIPLHPPLATKSSMPQNSIYENTGMQAFQVNLTIEWEERLEDNKMQSNKDLWCYVRWKSNLKDKSLPSHLFYKLWNTHSSEHMHIEYNHKYEQFPPAYTLFTQTAIWHCISRKTPTKYICNHYIYMYCVS